jgi:L-methionine (R)-S-oxide reductase
MSARRMEKDMARDYSDDGHGSNAGAPEGLGEVARLLEGSEHLDGHWPQLAARIATLLNAENCWIVLAGSDDDGGMAVRAYGNDGAVQVKKSAGKGFARHPMLARASAMLVPQPQPQAHAPAPVHHYDAGDNAIFTPICVDDMVLGILNIQGKKTDLPFNEMHFETSRVVALLIGKTLHVGRLRKILNSRFAQLALMQPPASGTVTLGHALRHPHATATLMAKTFYKEMASAGFTPPEIIAAASEIISELTITLKSRGKKPLRD